MKINGSKCESTHVFHIILEDENLYLWVFLFYHLTLNNKTELLYSSLQASGVKDCAKRWCPDVPYQTLGRHIGIGGYLSVYSLSVLFESKTKSFIYDVKLLSVPSAGLLEMGGACGCKSSLSQPSGCHDLLGESQHQILPSDQRPAGMQ